MTSSITTINDKRREDGRRNQAQILHRLKAGMKAAAEVSLDIGVHVITVNKHMRDMEVRGDLKRSKVEHTNAFVIEYICDSLGLTDAYPYSDIDTTEKPLPGGTIHNLGDRPATWNAQPLRKSERVFVNCSQLWA